VLRYSTCDRHSTVFTPWTPPPQKRRQIFYHGNGMCLTHLKDMTLLTYPLTHSLTHSQQLYYLVKCLFFHQSNCMLLKYYVIPSILLQQITMCIYIITNNVFIFSFLLYLCLSFTLFLKWLKCFVRRDLLFSSFGMFVFALYLCRLRNWSLDCWVSTQIRNWN
jgi:hypothetical protein